MQETTDLATGNDILQQPVKPVAHIPYTADRRTPRSIDPDTRRTFEGIFFTLGLTVAVVVLVLAVVALT